ncbi:MAG: ABC transporter permease [Candidatus Korarchaeum sp.]
MSLLSLFKSGVLLDLYFVKNNKANLVAFLLWPYLTLLLILGAGLFLGSAQSFRVNVGSDVDPIAFFVSSTLIASASLSVMWDVGGSVLLHRWAGTLPYVLLSPHRTSTILVMSYIPRYVFWSFIQLAEFLPILLWRKGLGAMLDAGVIALAMLVGVLPLLGFSAIFASFLLVLREESNVLSWLNPVILILSGAFYPSHLFPLWARLLSQLLPTTHTFELARLSALMSGPILRDALVIMGVLLGMAALYNALSYAAMGEAERKALGSGSI